jgi:hypothetical protein
MSGLKHQRSAAMKHYAGLDVSIKETSVCVKRVIVASCYDRRARSEPVSDCRKVRASMGAALRQSDKIVVLKRELANGV